MAVFRIDKTRDYTVMSNHHLKNKKLSLKAKGLLSLMLSLPDDWDYTTKGLARICKDGIDSICSGVQELEEQGYVTRRRIRNEKGQLTEIEYTIMEQPIPTATKGTSPKRENPVLDNPILGKPVLGLPEQAEPEQENPAQLNTNRSKTNPVNTLSQNPYPIKSYPINLNGAASDGMGTDEMGEYREIVKENIEYDTLKADFPYSCDRLDEIVELMAETLCSKKAIICIAGDDYPASTVKAKLLRIDSLHIQYVFECLDKNTSEIRNIKKYLLAVLFNAPSTIGSYYKAQVNHTLYGD